MRNAGGQTPQRSQLDLLRLGICALHIFHEDHRAVSRIALNCNKTQLGLHPHIQLQTTLVRGTCLPP